MQITSRKKSLPPLSGFVILVSLALMVSGVTKISGEGRVLQWIHVVTGICLFVSCVANMMNEVVQIVVDDDTIHFLRRRGPGFIVSRAKIFWSDVRPKQIRFWFQGPLDVQGASIPLKLFEGKDVEKLLSTFTPAKNAQQAAAGQPATTPRVGG